MIAADHPDRAAQRLLIVHAAGGLEHLGRADLASLFRPGDLVVANDAATIPASLFGEHERTGGAIEIRLAAFVNAADLTQFVAVAFGAGNHRAVTESRPMPPTLVSGDRLLLGPLTATVVRLCGHPRLVELQFHGDPPAILAGLARHGKPIQYAHVPAPLAMWDVWTNLAAKPFAFEAPSAGFALDWQTLTAWRRRGIGLATITHAAGISSTGDPDLDQRLPLDEPYIIPEATAHAIEETTAQGGSIIAIGTTVVRALESAATTDGRVPAGPGVARGRIGPKSRLRVVDTVLSGMHEPGESHFELLRAFVDDQLLFGAHRSATERNYRTHEFGDAVLIERPKAA